MELSESGRKLLIKLEGKYPKKYLDVAGKPTIGVGHLLTPSELSSGVYDKELTDEQIELLLMSDVRIFEDVVNTFVAVNLSQNQFDALVIFTFNIGKYAFKNSTLLKALNQKKYEAIPDQLRRWCKAGGKEVAGLKNRREAEIKLWNEVPKS